MPQPIGAEQNTSKQLERLAAQRQLYTDAKTNQKWQIIFSVPVVIAWSSAVAFWPGIKVGSALWGIALTILDLAFYTPKQRDLKTKAARIQELFDTDVLDLPWHKLKVGRQPDPEIVAEAALRHRSEDPEYTRLKVWYPVDVNDLPMHVGRIVCQRANCWWDANLRRRYAYWILWIIGAFSAFILIISLFGDFTLERFILAALVPLMPAFMLAIRQAREQRDAVARADRLKEACEDLWEKALSSTVSEEQLLYLSRQLQDEIYDHRRQSPLTLDWIYHRLRDTHEDQMNKAAETLIDEALAALAARARSAEAGGQR